MDLRGIILAAVLAAVPWPAVTAAHAPAQTPPSPPPAAATDTAPATVSRYTELVERVKKGDATVDLADLREAFTETPDYRARMMGVYQSLWTPLGRGDFPAALQVAERVLDTNYVEINAHMVASIAQQQMGNVDRAAYHRNIANGLLRVVMSRGDGATPDTAWSVIDISEEYAVMRALNLALQGQGLSMAGGHSMDILDVVDGRSKQQRKLYFNVDRSMAAMTRARQTGNQPER